MSSEHEKEKRTAISAVAPHGWTVARVGSNGYTLMYCACGLHQKTLKKTPSNPNHFRLAARWMITTCSVS